MTDERGIRTAGRKEGGITFGGIATFMKVAETLSFSQAAKALGVSQPSVSVQIATLETACGLPLFNRRPRLELTDYGREFFHRARAVISRMSELDDVMRDLRELRRGKLTIGFSTPHYAMPLVAKFMATHPSVDIATRLGNTTQLIELIADCKVDLGIMSLPAPNPGLFCQMFAAPRLMIGVHVDNPLVGRRELSPDDIRHQPLILRETGSVTRQVFEATCREAGFDPRPFIVAGSNEAVCEAIAAGIGVGPIFDGTLREHQTVRLLPFGTIPETCGVYVVMAKEARQLPAVDAFMQIVQT
ncbi:LysR family transcriptional regulator [Chelatococcus asaccharovorans]|uniref:DNA-binding transcriptional LysR family regulator n=1 Tax=Chelatococcus asaccharovorans TaxID=28210 RepID=A0A2V3UJP6_9HYPH|nr:LysR family transcriptional regulator [Chelatococcus asaccharovorans]MBS7701769.1 LysR family transcriptional regulator [Chelatococcus asaccharovorans]PXW64524.1 DNA-binding transcriptional LysR family regulator [Chelatococcus asaccharovorans]